MQSLVDLAEERPEAMQLMRGRTFARARSLMPREVVGGYWLRRAPGVIQDIDEPWDEREEVKP